MGNGTATAKSRSVVKKTAGDEQVDAALEGGIIRPEDLVDDTWYFKQLALNAEELRQGKTNELNAGRRQDYLAKLYKLVTGQDLSTASRTLRSNVERLEDESLLERNEKELRELDEIIKGVPGLSMAKKKRWLDAIALTIECQKFARSCSLGTWLYVCRDSEGEGGVMRPAKIHVQFHENWTGRYTLTEAPPGHGKTVNFHGKKLYDIGNRPWRRCLFLHDVKDKAGKELELIKKYIRSGRFRAVYPKVRVLERTEGAKDNSMSFAVVRPNEFSREPTVEAAGSRSNTQGNGYDTIYADDICKPDEAHHPAIRQQTNFKWENEHSKRLRDPEKAEVHMVFTSWDEDDVPNRIKASIRKGTAYQPWQYHASPLTFDADGNPISLWPGRYPIAFYANEQATLSPRDFGRLYLHQCKPAADRLVHRIWFYPADVGDPVWTKISSEMREAYLERLETIHNGQQWLSIDPSATRGKDSAECPVLQFSLTASGHGYLVDAWHFPGDPVMVQQWVSDAICGNVSPGKDWRIPKKVDMVLWEEGSPQSAQITLWEDYIRRDIKKRNIQWGGSFIRVRPVGMYGRQAVGKRVRLSNCAPYIDNGYVKMPGRMHYDAKQNKISFVCSPRDNIRKVADQLMNFPSGLVDAVDAFTQWVIYNERRLRRENENIAAPAAPKEEIFNSYKEGLKVLKKQMRTPRDISEMEREYEWNKGMLG